MRATRRRIVTAARSWDEFHRLTGLGIGPALAAILSAPCQKHPARRLSGCPACERYR